MSNLDETFALLYFCSAVLYVLINTSVYTFLLLRNKCKLNTIFKISLSIYEMVFICRGFTSCILYLNVTKFHGPG
jgi:hypothetical protein